MMVDNVRITFDVSIQKSLSSDDIIRLAESIHAFIDAGIIECEEDEEIVVDQKFLIELTKGIENVRKSVKSYGRDREGFIKYPYWKED